MELKGRDGVRHNSSGTFIFDENLKIAKSYYHWNLLINRKGKLILNEFRYSATTNKHIKMLKKILEALKWKYEIVNSSTNIV